MTMQQQVNDLVEAIAQRVSAELGLDLHKTAAAMSLSHVILVAVAM